MNTSLVTSGLQQFPPDDYAKIYEVNSCPSDLPHIPHKYRDDEKIVLRVLEMNGYLLKFVSDRLKKKRNVVMIAVRRDGGAIQFADVSLRNDKKIFIAAFESSRLAIQFIGDDLKTDPQLCDMAIECNGSFIRFFDAVFADNYDVGLKAVSSNGDALKYLSSRLQNNEEIVLEALNCTLGNFVFRYASDHLKQHKSFLRKALSISRLSIYQMMDEQLKNDKELYQIMFQTGIYFVFQHAGPVIRNDKQLAIEAIKAVNNNFFSIGDSLKNNDELAYYALIGAHDRKRVWNHLGDDIHSAFKDDNIDKFMSINCELYDKMDEQ